MYITNSIRKKWYRLIFYLIGSNEKKKKKRKRDKYSEGFAKACFSINSSFFVRSSQVCSFVCVLRGVRLAITGAHFGLGLTIFDYNILHASSYLFVVWCITYAHPSQSNSRPI